LRSSRVARYFGWKFHSNPSKRPSRQNGTLVPVEGPSTASLATLFARVFDGSADHHIARTAVIGLRNGPKFSYLVQYPSA